MLNLIKNLLARLTLLVRKAKKVVTTNPVAHTVPAAPATTPKEAVPTADHTNLAKVLKKAELLTTLTMRTNKSLTLTIVATLSIEVEAEVVAASTVDVGVTAPIGKKRDLSEVIAGLLKMKKSNIAVLSKWL